MSLPDFERAQYVEPQILSPQQTPGYAGDYRPIAENNAFPRAIAFGVAAAVLGSLVYATIGLSGWMVSIVAIGVAWAIAKAMMTATGGIGGRNYQIAAVVLTYLAVSFADVLDIFYYAHKQDGYPLSHLITHNVPLILKYTIAGPFLELSGGINGILGLVILFIGMRAAWRMAAGGPGFGQGSGPRTGPFGLR